MGFRCLKPSRLDGEGSLTSESWQALVCLAVSSIRCSALYSEGKWQGECVWPSISLPARSALLPGLLWQFPRCVWTESLTLCTFMACS